MQTRSWPAIPLCLDTGRNVCHWWSRELRTLCTNNICFFLLLPNRSLLPPLFFPSLSTRRSRAIPAFEQHLAQFEPQQFDGTWTFMAARLLAPLPGRRSAWGRAACAPAGLLARRAAARGTLRSLGYISCSGTASRSTPRAAPARTVPGCPPFGPGGSPSALGPTSRGLPPLAGKWRSAGRRPEDRRTQS